MPSECQGVILCPGSLSADGMWPMRDIGLLFIRVQGKLDTMSSYIRLQMGIDFGEILWPVIPLSPQTGVQINHPQGQCFVS